MNFYPAQYRPFSEERHPPPNPPAIISPSIRHRWAEPLLTINSLKISSESLLKNRLGPSKVLSKASLKISSKVALKVSPGASSTQTSFPSKLSFTRSKSSTTPPSTPTLDCLEVVSTAPSSAVAASYISLVLNIQNQFAHNAELSQNAVFLPQEEVPSSYTPPVPIDGNSTNFPTRSSNHLARVSSENEKISKIISKTPQSIIMNVNFGNPWYVLEIQETSGEPCFVLVATYLYQLVLSSLKCPPQLGIRTFEVEEEGEITRVLHERHSLTYHVEKLGKQSRVGYLREEDLGDKSKRIFIKMLDLDDEAGNRGEITDQGLALELIRQTDQLYNEIILLDKIPFHPHIMLPIGYITLGGEDESDKDKDKVVGYISDYYKYGRLSDYLFLPNMPGKPRVPRRIKLIQKAKWAYQIISAVKHLHRTAQISLGEEGHGFGLERFMIDEYMQLHLIGFGDGEKVSRLSWRIPPEAHVRGEWDVTMEKSDAKGPPGCDRLVWKRNTFIRLMFEKENLVKLNDLRVGYPSKPPSGLCSAANSLPGGICNIGGRGNNNIDVDKSQLDVDKDRTGAEEIKKGIHRRKQCYKEWSAFKEWRHIPGALEMVETYSVGIMLWLLFEQISPETLKDGEDIPVTWTQVENWTQCWPIPRKWQTIVEDCVKVDPSERISLDEVLATFVKEVGKRWDVGWVMG